MILRTFKLTNPNLKINDFVGLLLFQSAEYRYLFTFKGKELAKIKKAKYFGVLGPEKIKNLDYLRNIS